MYTMKLLKKEAIKKDIVLHQGYIKSQWIKSSLSYLLTMFSIIGETTRICVLEKL